MNLQQFFADAFAATRARQTQQQQRGFLSARNARRIGAFDVLRARDVWKRPAGVRPFVEARDVPLCEHSWGG